MKFLALKQLDQSGFADSAFEPNILFSQWTKRNYLFVWVFSRFQAWDSHYFF